MVLTRFKGFFASGVFPLQQERSYFRFAESMQRHCGHTLPAEEDWTFRNRPPIRRYRAGNLFEKRSFSNSAKRLNVGNGCCETIGEHSSASAFRPQDKRVRGSIPRVACLPCGPIRAPVSGGKICSPDIPQFQHRGLGGEERGAEPLFLTPNRRIRGCCGII